MRSSQPHLTPAGVPARLRGPVLAGVAGKAAEAVTLVLLAMLVPRLLGPVDYGLFSVGSTVVTLGALVLTLGGPTLLARYVPAVPEPDRPAVAYALTVRLARNRAALLAAVTVVAVVLAATATVPPVAVACVLVALVLTVTATLVLQADLGLGRPLAWCLRYPVQNAVLVAAVLALYGPLGLDGAWAALTVAAVAGAAVAGAASGPLRRGAAAAPVPLPEGALGFGLLQAAGAALAQVVHRGGVLAVALLAGSVEQTGFAALAISIALAATYAVAQLFTVALPVVVAGTAGEPALRRMAGLLLAVVTVAALGVAVAVDTVVPAVFGPLFAGASAAFVPALAMIVLAPVTALTVQVAALRTQPAAVLRAGVAGALAFLVVAAVAVPAWGATGATTAALAGTAAIAAVSALLLPGGVRARLAIVTTAAVAAVLITGALL